MKWDCTHTILASSIVAGYLAQDERFGWRGTAILICCGLIVIALMFLDGNRKMRD